MMSKIFVDTNILVYAADGSEPMKQKTSRMLLKALRNEQSGVISTQVLQEFYVTAVKKLGIDSITTKSIVHALRNFETVVVDEDLIEEAIDCSVLNRLSFWDSLVVVSAEKAHCHVLWTEDLNHGQVIRGVRIENPFRNMTGEVHETSHEVYCSTE